VKEMVAPLVRTAQGPTQCPCGVRELTLAAGKRRIRLTRVKTVRSPETVKLNPNLPFFANWIFHSPAKNVAAAAHGQMRSSRRPVLGPCAIRLRNPLAGSNAQIKCRGYALPRVDWSLPLR
jgi:hypothetical protein